MSTLQYHQILQQADALQKLIEEVDKKQQHIDMLEANEKRLRGIKRLATKSLFRSSYVF